MAIETVEGSAEYCGTKAIRDISKESYEKRIEDYKGILLNDIPLLFDIRRISYYTGALFLFLLDQLEILFIQEINKQNKYIFEEIVDKFKYGIIDIKEIQEPEIEKRLTEHIDKINLKFQNFFKGDIKKYEGDFRICGYDPMNMIKQGNEILCGHFIMLMENLNNKQIFIEGPVVINLKEGGPLP